MIDLPPFAQSRHWNKLVYGELELVPERYWCGQCLDPTTHPTGFATESSVFQHAKNAHDIVAPNLYRDCYSTGRIIECVEAFWRDVEEASAKLNKVFEDPNYGPDDLLVDCGYRLAPGEFGEF